MPTIEEEIELLNKKSKQNIKPEINSTPKPETICIHSGFILNYSDLYNAIPEEILKLINEKNG